MKAEDVLDLVPGCKLYLQLRNPTVLPRRITVQSVVTDVDGMFNVTGVVGDAILLFPDEIYEEGNAATCKHCCEAIVLDKHANWRRQDGESDLCADSNDSIAVDQTHEPWCKPLPSLDDIADDLTCLLADVSDDEQDDYDNCCMENPLDDCESHIYRVAERLQHFEELLREAPNMLKLLVRLRATEDLASEAATQLHAEMHEMVKKLEHYLVS